MRELRGPKKDRKRAIEKERGLEIGALHRFAEIRKEFHCSRESLNVVLVLFLTPDNSLHLRSLILSLRCKRTYRNGLNIWFYLVLLAKPTISNFYIRLLEDGSPRRSYSENSPFIWHTYLEECSYLNYPPIRFFYLCNFSSRFFFPCLF